MYMYIRRNIIMATSKDTKKETAVVEEVKATAKKAPAKKTTAKKETVKKEAAKPAAKKETVKKEAAKPAAKKETVKKEAAKPAAKKETAKKPAAKKPAMKVNMHVQFSDKDYEAEAIYEIAINNYVEAGNKKSSIKNLEAYVKAEDNKVYYVVNGDYRGEVWL